MSHASHKPATKMPSRRFNLGVCYSQDAIATMQRSTERRIARLNSKSNRLQRLCSDHKKEAPMKKATPGSTVRAWQLFEGGVCADAEVRADRNTTATVRIPRSPVS